MDDYLVLHEAYQVTFHFQFVKINAKQEIFLNFVFAFTEKLKLIKRLKNTI